MIVLWASISYSKIIHAIQLRACLELPFGAFVSTRCRSSIVFLAIDFKLFLVFFLVVFFFVSLSNVSVQVRQFPRYLEFINKSAVRTLS